MPNDAAKEKTDLLKKFGAIVSIIIILYIYSNRCRSNIIINTFITSTLRFTNFVALSVTGKTVDPASIVNDKHYNNVAKKLQIRRKVHFIRINLKI